MRVTMRPPFKRKSRLQQLLAKVRKELPDRPSGKAVRNGLIAVGGFTGLTAGSAGISSLRRHREAQDES
ncbi:MAG: hypothetical protein WAQ33_00285 [Gaiellaceae bacterium]